MNRGHKEPTIAGTLRAEISHLARATQHMTKANEEALRSQFDQLRQRFETEKARYENEERNALLGQLETIHGRLVNPRYVASATRSPLPMETVFRTQDSNDNSNHHHHNNYQHQHQHRTKKDLHGRGKANLRQLQQMTFVKYSPPAGNDDDDDDDGNSQHDDGAYMNIRRDMAEQTLDNAREGKPMVAFLIYGPPGTGKSSMVRQLALSLGAHLIAPDVSGIPGRLVSEAELRMRQILDVALQLFESGERVVLLVDEVDAIFAQKASAAPRDTGAGGGGGSATGTMAVLLNTHLDEFDASAQRRKFKGEKFDNFYMLIATSNKCAALEESTQRRFARMEMPYPDGPTRLAAAKYQLRALPPPPQQKPTAKQAAEYERAVEAAASAIVELTRGDRRSATASPTVYTLKNVQELTEAAYVLRREHLKTREFLLMTHATTREPAFFKLADKNDDDKDTEETRTGRRRRYTFEQVMGYRNGCTIAVAHRIPLPEDCKRAHEAMRPPVVSLAELATYYPSKGRSSSGSSSGNSNSDRLLSLVPLS